MACSALPRNATLHLHIPRQKITIGRSKKYSARCQEPSKAVNPPTIYEHFKFGSPLPQERWTILKAILSESLNPLSLDLSRFIAARRITDNTLAGFVQLKHLEPGKMELSSLVVLPEHRGQGLGTALVEKLLQKQAATGEKEPEIFLITTSKKKSFYARCGFEEVLEKDMDGVPAALQLEKAIGTPIASLVAGDSLVVLRQHR